MADVVPENSDAGLIEEIRRGHMEAAAELFARHHGSATRFAAGLAGPSDAEDLVSEAFVRTLAQLREGGGPDIAFRPYLLTAVRNTWTSRARKDARVTWLEDYADAEPVDEASSSPADIDPSIDLDVLRRAFDSLPHRWQVVLWHTTVDGDPPTVVGTLLGTSPGAVSALAYRARRGLAQAYLAALVDAGTAERCRTVRPLLPGLHRGDLGESDRTRVERHLLSCDDCAATRPQVAALLSRRVGLALATALLGSAGGLLHSLAGWETVPAVAAAAGPSTTGTASSTGSSTAGTLSGGLTAVGTPALVVAAAVAVATLVVGVGVAATGGDALRAGGLGPVTAPSASSSPQPPPSTTPTEDPTVVDRRPEPRPRKDGPPPTVLPADPTTAPDPRGVPEPRPLLPEPVAVSAGSDQDRTDDPEQDGTDEPTASSHPAAEAPAPVVPPELAPPVVPALPPPTTLPATGPTPGPVPTAPTPVPEPSHEPLPTPGPTPGLLPVPGPTTNPVLGPRPTPTPVPGPEVTPTPGPPATPDPGPTAVPGPTVIPDPAPSPEPEPEPEAPATPDPAPTATPKLLDQGSPVAGDRTTR